MWNRLLIATGLLVTALLVWYFFPSEGFTTKYVEAPSSAPLIEANQYRGDADITASGPNPPNTRVRGSESYSAEPTPTDPYEETVESANAPESLRAPERSFGPGVIPEDTELAVRGGMANATSAHSAVAFQQFSPEFATNGGAWLDNVSANEQEIGATGHYSTF